MLKRITKLTGLLVFIATVTSTIPAKADDVQKIEAQDGTIYSALAKGTGIYIDGEINDNDEAQYWISADGKYNVLDDLDGGDAAQDLLLNKYLEIDEDTMVDITTNEVIDDNTRADLQDDVATTIRKEIRDDNDDRFSDSDELKDSTAFLAAGSGLSIYKYTLETPGVGKTQDAIYVDYAGNYVDADYNLGSVKVTTTGGSITFKNTEDTYEVDEDGTTYEYKAEITDSKYITDVSDYIYRWANLSIYRKEKGEDDSNYENVTDSVGFGSKSYNDFVSDGATSVTVLQKFSKTAASDDIDGIKYSKDSDIYYIADEDGESEVVLGKSAQESASELNEDYDSGNDKAKIIGNAQGFTSVYLNYTNSKIYAQNLQLKSKNGFNYIDLGDYDSTDTDVRNALKTPGGILWVLDSGYIKKWDGDENFTKVYKVDGSMNNIALSSKDNIIVWNEDDGVYSVIHNIAPAVDAATTTNTTVSADNSNTATATGWVLNKDNTWNYVLEDGTKKTGWHNDNGTWYYLSATGALQTGWVQDNGNWYYLNSSGAMQYNTTVDGYALGADGAWVK